MKPKVVAIVQARMSSTRLPGKALKCVLDRPLLQYLVERLQRAISVDKIVLATSKEHSDDVIEIFCESQAIACFRGALDDVLQRFKDAAEDSLAEIIVRITADCPLIDPAIVDKVINHFLKYYPKLDYASNTLIRTYPRGMDVEVFSIKALRRAAKESILPYEREHVTPYIYRHYDEFLLSNVQQEPDLSHMRLTVDTQEDFQLICHLIEALYPIFPQFSIKEILKCLKQHPEWLKINSTIQQKK